MDWKKEVKGILKAEMVRKGVSQEELAERSGISYKNIQYLESKNPTCPGLRTLEKLAKALKIPISKLLDFR